MSERAPYSRVYWSVMDDAKFDGIREDVRVFGSWSLMLVVADMAYPAPAFVPPTVPKAAFARLVESGLIEDLGGHRFRVHGLRKEREMRTDSARNAAAVRWQSGRNAEPMPRRDETRQDEHLAREGLPSLTPEAIAALETWTGRPWSQAGDKQLGEFDRLVGEYGLAAVSAAAASVMNGHPLTARQLIWPVMKILEPMPDLRVMADLERESERREASSKGTEQTLRYTHGLGAHEVEKHPRCPVCQEAAP